VIRPYAAYLFDLDGTLYRGETALPGAVETVQALVARGAAVRYLTNNSSLTLAQFATKLGGMGFPVTDSMVLSSGWGAARRLVEMGFRSAFVVGEPGLVSMLREAGITVENADDEGFVSPDGDQGDVVLVGIHRRFTYEIMSAAMQRLRSGKPFVATNPDTTFPLEGGRLVPGAGSIVAAIKACGGVDPILIGKPEPYLIEVALADLNLEPSEALVVGDRIDTDIESGRRAGCDTFLVLTGVEATLPEGQLGASDVTGLVKLRVSD
jgi:4-nitrophenyl phosphatase